MGVVTITIGLSTIFTIISLIYRYRHILFGIFMKDAKKYLSGVVKNSIRLLNIKLKEYVSILVEKGKTDMVLSLKKEIEERIAKEMED
jgi:hypothetical protein